MEIASTDIKADLDDIEDKIIDVLRLESRTEEQLQSIGLLAAYVLNELLSCIDPATGIRGWALDDLYIQDSSESGTKMAISGVSYWLNGGADCYRFKADIAKGIDPLLYSFKFYGESIQ